MPTRKCQAKDPNNCPYHGFNQNLTNQNVEDRKTSLISELYEKNGITFSETKQLFECESRDKLKSLQDLSPNQQPDLTKVELRQCNYCEHKHLYRKDYTEDYWTPQNKFNILEAYMREINKNLPPEQKKTMPDLEVDILFRGAKEYYKDIRMDRDELLQWYQCGRKIAHKTLIDAENKIRPEQKEQGYETYSCPYGEHYHIGRKKSVGSNKAIMEHAHKAYLMYRKNKKLKPEHQRFPTKRV